MPALRVQVNATRPRITAEAKSFIIGSPVKIFFIRTLVIFSMFFSANFFVCTLKASWFFV